jgi:hypothetical protein
VLSGVSRELWSVDTLLAEQKTFKFAIRSVAGVEDVRLFSRYVKTEGWVPVEAQIKVSDVASLVERLGGKELYGENVTVPLRELIQNGSDAILAKQAIIGNPKGSDCVKVSLHEEDGQWIFEVSDSGVGMSEEEMCGPLLDFGKSFWGSDQVRRRLPGLRSSGFNPTGRYGIGFFSVFMLGAKVEVISRRFDAAANDSKVLFFDKGVRSRPLLRSADHSDRLFDGGTRVRVWLDKDPTSAGGFLAGNFNDLPKLSLADLCAWLCPSLPTNLQVRTGNEDYQTVLQANDWLNIDSASLLKRVLRPIPETETERLATVIERNRDNVRNLLDEDGNVLGRGCILLQDRNEIDNKSDRGPITVGGCRASGMHNFGGVLIGRSLRAARDSARPLIDGDPVRHWATEQAGLIVQVSNDPELLTVGAAYVRSFGGNVSRMPIALSSQGWMTPEQVRAFVANIDEVAIVTDTTFHFAGTNRRIKLMDNVLVCNAGHWQNEWPTSTPWTWHGSSFHYWTLLGATVEAIAEGWSSPLDAVLQISKLTTDERPFRRQIATTGAGNPIVDRVDIVKRPTVLHNGTP